MGIVSAILALVVAGMMFVRAQQAKTRVDGADPSAYRLIGAGLVVSAVCLIVAEVL